MRSNSPALTVSQRLQNAARTGDELVFAYLVESNPELNIVSIIDKEGLSLLDCAAYYGEGTSADVIRQKKKIVRHLLQYFKKDSVEFKNALNLTAKNGCYQTGKELLAVDNIDMDDLRSAFGLAGKYGHQRISHSILSSANHETNKIKIKTNPLFENNDNAEPLILVEAKNLNLSDDDFLIHLKKSDKIEYDIDGKTINAIDLRVESMREKYRSRNIRTAVLGALCPAMALAAFFATFGGVYPEPVLASILTIAILPVVFIPLAYISYKSRMKEYGSVAAETMHLGWKSSRMAAQKHDFSEKLENIFGEIARYNQQLSDVNSQEELDVLKQKIKLSQQKYQKLQSEMAKIVELSDDKKPKVALKYMSREKFKAKKNLGLYDAKSNSKWTSTGESVRAFAGYSAEVLCAVDGGLALGSALAALFVSKVGMGFLGAATVGFLTGPVGIAVVLSASALLLAMSFGVLLYKSSYKHEKNDTGKLNRGLILAHDVCKKSADFSEVNKKRITLNQTIKTLDHALVLKEKSLSSPRPSIALASLSSSKLSDNPSSLIAKGLRDDDIPSMPASGQGDRNPVRLKMSQP